MRDVLGRFVALAPLIVLLGVMIYLAPGVFCVGFGVIALMIFCIWLGK